MGNMTMKSPTELEELEAREWIDSIDCVLQHESRGRTERLRRRLLNRVTRDGTRLKYELVTPYVNMISVDHEPAYPGNLELEARFGTLIRWNAMAMVVRANRKEHGIGGHLARYAAQSTLFEVGLNHFFRTYDPAFAHEIAVIIQDGVRRMYVAQASIFYYLTLMNENYATPAVANIGAVKEGILKDMYKFRTADSSKAKLHAQFLSSGTIVNEALKAQKLLAEKCDVAADVWSVTSYKQLYTDVLIEIFELTNRWTKIKPCSHRTKLDCDVPCGHVGSLSEPTRAERFKLD